MNFKHSFSNFITRNFRKLRVLSKVDIIAAFEKMRSKNAEAEEAGLMLEDNGANKVEKTLSPVTGSEHHNTCKARAVKWIRGIKDMPML